MKHLGKKIAGVILVGIMLALLGMGVIVGAMVGFAAGLTL